MSRTEKGPYCGEQVTLYNEGYVLGSGRVVTLDESLDGPDAEGFTTRTLKVVILMQSRTRESDE